MRRIIEETVNEAYMDMLYEAIDYLHKVFSIDQIAKIVCMDRDEVEVILRDTR